MISLEGGGAIAYPVMTLMFEIDPSVARNFSLAIQSIGMTAASLWIIAKKIPIEKHTWALWRSAVRWELYLGPDFIAPYVVSAYAKMMFVSFWLSYGVGLFLSTTSANEIRCALCQRSIFIKRLS